MSALVILECNACGAITPPWPTADKAREEAGPDGWAVDVTGDGIDYCPQCTAPVNPALVATPSGMPFLGPVAVPRSRLDVARKGISELRNALLALSMTVDLAASQSVANLGRVRADQLLEELAS